LRTPEVTKVRVSSFWDEEYRCQDHRQLFDIDKQAVLEELRNLPGETMLRRTNTMVERMRRVRAHYCVLSFIRSQIPWFLRLLGSEDRTRRWLHAHLERLLAEAKRFHKISSGDMPSLTEFGKRLFSLESVQRLPVFDSEIVEELQQAIRELSERRCERSWKPIAERQCMRCCTMARESCKKCTMCGQTGFRFPSVTL